MTALADLIADDWQYMDDIKEGLILDPSRTPKTTSPVKILTGNLTQGPTGSASVLIDEPEASAFHLWVSTIVPVNVEPEVDDVLLIEGEYWTIQKRKLTTLDTRWKLTCVKQR